MFKLNLNPVKDETENRSREEGFGFSKEQERRVTRIYHAAVKREEPITETLKWITEHENIQSLEELVYAIYEYALLETALRSEPKLPHFGGMMNGGILEAILSGRGALDTLSSFLESSRKSGVVDIMMKDGKTFVNGKEITNPEDEE